MPNADSSDYGYGALIPGERLEARHRASPAAVDTHDDTPTVGMARRLKAGRTFTEGGICRITASAARIESISQLTVSHINFSQSKFVNLNVDTLYILQSETVKRRDMVKTNVRERMITHARGELKRVLLSI